MAIDKIALNRIVSISMDGNDNVTHAWQVTTFSIQEDGKELSRSQSDAENIDPAKIGKAIPQAKALDRQWDQMTHALAERERQLAAMAEQHEKIVAGLVAERDALATRIEAIRAAVASG